MKKILVIFILILSLFGAIETFAGSYTPSRYSTSPSQISFSNNSSNNSVSIYWVDFDGNERYYTTLNARATYVQDTYIGHIWNVRNTANSNLLATVVSNYSYQQSTVSVPSTNGNASPGYATSSSRIYFTNSSNVNVTIYWVDQNGNERNYRTLVPGESYTQETNIDHIWVVRQTNLGTEMGRTVSTNSYQTYTVSQRFYDSSYGYQTSPYGYVTNSNVTYFPNSYPTYGNGYTYTSNPVVYRSVDSWSQNANPLWSTYDDDHYSTRQVCELYDGAYNDIGFYPVINGATIVGVESFRKKGSKVYFSTYDTYVDGSLRTTRWVLNCKNGAITQR